MDNGRERTAEDLERRKSPRQREKEEETTSALKWADLFAASKGKTYATSKGGRKGGKGQKRRIQLQKEESFNQLAREKRGRTIVEREGQVTTPI